MGFWWLFGPRDSESRGGCSGSVGEGGSLGEDDVSEEKLDSMGEGGIGESGESSSDEQDGSSFLVTCAGGANDEDPVPALGLV